MHVFPTLVCAYRLSVVFTPMLVNFNTYLLDNKLLCWVCSLYILVLLYSICTIVILYAAFQVLIDNVNEVLECATITAV